MIYGFGRPLPEIPDAEHLVGERKPFPTGVAVKSRSDAYPLFSRLVSAGMAGICISGRGEKEMREELGMDGIPVVDAKTLLKGMNEVEARDALYFVVSDSAMDGGTVVLMDSLEKFTGSAGMRKLIDDLKAMGLKGFVIYAGD
jgi:hypothetical protein